MRKIMILGASYSLVPLIRAAKRLGYRTVVTSIPGDYPGFAEGDEQCLCDITKPREIAAAAAERQAEGIATCCMDVGLFSQGYTVSELGLTGPSLDTVAKCTNKYLMKQAFAEFGVNTADFRYVSGREDLEKACGELSFPLIIKAVDQMGSRGIFRCESREELLRFYPDTMAATGKDYCIVEEFLEGTMFGVEAMVQDGKLVYMLPVGNVLHDGNPPFPVGHYVPWEEGIPYGERIREEIERAVLALGADNCPLDFDMMLKDGEIYVIEATARAGATCLADQVGIHFGIDYYEAIVRLAMGEPVARMFERESSRRTPNAVRILETGQHGVVREIIPGTEEGGDVVELSFNIQEGDRVRPMENGRDRIGQAVVKGESAAQCLRLLDEIIDKIEIKVCHGDEE